VKLKAIRIFKMTPKIKALKIRNF